MQEGLKEIIEGKFYEYGSFSIISNYCNGYSVIDFDNRKMLKCVDTLDEAVNVINQYEQTKNKEEADYENY